MSSRWRNAAVAIFTGEGDAKGRVGTGILVAPNLILTAAHVVISERATGVVRLRWPSTDGFQDAVEREAGDRGVVWCCRDLDLALIACTPPSAISPVPIDWSEPRDRGEWASEAFPTISRHCRTQAAYLTGKHGGPNKSGRSTRFPLIGDVDIKDGHGKPVNMAEWTGASGAAVMHISGDRDAQLIGIIVTEHTDFKNRLDAVPLCEARHDAGFMKLIRPGREENKEKCLRNLREALDKLYRLAGSISLSCLFELGGPCEKGVDIGDIAEYLASRVEFSAAIEAIATIHEDSAANKAIRDAAYDVGRALAACSPGQLLSNELLYHGGAKFSRVQAGGLIGVEIALAGFEGRAASFKNRRKPGDHPPGTQCLETVPEGGINGTSPVNLDDLAQRLGQDIGDELGRSEGTPAPKSYLKNQARLKRPRFYVAYPARPHQSIERLVLEADKLDLPHVLVTAYDPSLIEEDEDRFGILREMIPIHSATDQKDKA